MNAKERLIVALDVDGFSRAEKMVDLLSGEADIFKVGIAPFTGYGEVILKKLQKSGKKVFLDLKFHDIPNTVRNAAKAAAEKGVFMMNFHCSGGMEMMRAAVKGVEEVLSVGKRGRPILLGVTVLTSMAKEDLKDTGRDMRKEVLGLARTARDAGLDGVVASAQEARIIKEDIGRDFIVVTPGVRPAWAAAGDQKRVMTPAEAVSQGADYIVVGRPILEAQDPALAAKKIVEEMER